MRLRGASRPAPSADRVPVDERRRERAADARQTGRERFFVCCSRDRLTFRVGAPVPLSAVPGGGGEGGRVPPALRRGVHQVTTRPLGDKFHRSNNKTVANFLNSKMPCILVTGCGEFYVQALSRILSN